MSAPCCSCLNALAAQLLERLARIEQRVDRLADPARPAEWLSVEQFAQCVGRSAYSVREWARLGRITATKKSTGSGPYRPWVIHRDELTRFQREGLLPSPYAAITQRRTP